MIRVLKECEELDSKVRPCGSETANKETWGTQLKFYQPLCIYYVWRPKIYACPVITHIFSEFFIMVLIYCQLSFIILCYSLVKFRISLLWPSSNLNSSCHNYYKYGTKLYFHYYVNHLYIHGFLVL